MKLVNYFYLKILGGASIIIGWIGYHFFDFPFIEGIKFVVLGIIIVGFAFFMERRDMEIENVS